MGHPAHEMTLFDLVAAPGVSEQIADDAAQPAGPATRIVEICLTLPRGQKRLLCDVFAAGKVAGGAVGDRRNVILIAANQLGKRLAIAGLKSLDQLGIVFHDQLPHSMIAGWRVRKAKNKFAVTRRPGFRSPKRTGSERTGRMGRAKGVSSSAGLSSEVVETIPDGNK